MISAQNFDFSQSRSQLMTVQSLRLLFLTLVLFVILVYQLLNIHFISFDIFFSVYSLLALSFLFNLFYILTINKNSRAVGFSTVFLFVWEVIYITLLIHSIGVNQSLLIFLYLINIILCGVVFQRRGGVYLALLTSVCFSFLLALDPQITGNTLYLAVGINNLAFFAVAYLSGYLSEQLNFMGMELLERGRDIRALKNLNSLIIDGMPSGLLTIDNQGQILQYNRQAEQILAPGQSLLQKNVQAFIPPFRDLLSRMSGTPSLETQIADQRILRISFSALSDEKGKRLGSIVLFDDVTKLKKLESRLAQSEKMAAIGQLAAGIAHEIRNPLASISGSVQLMQGDAVQSEDSQKLMKIAMREIDRLNLLITEFLDYARPADLEKKKLSLSDLVQDVVESIRLDPLFKGITAQIQVEPDVFILGHADKLKQAFLNIMINALQAMEGRSVKVFSVDLKTKNEKALLCIGDTGVGISDSQIKKIFEPFHTTKSKGTGLGLAIVHSILESHSATIEVSSRVNEGTEFSLTFSRS